MGSAQEQWLKADLAANADKYCTLAFWHDPRFNSGHDGNADEMQPLFQALYNADADVVLGGHAHDYERFAPQNPSGQLDNARGIRQFVVGTGGAFFTSVEHAEAQQPGAPEQHLRRAEADAAPRAYDWQFVSESKKLHRLGHGPVPRARDRRRGRCDGPARGRDRLRGQRRRPARFGERHATTCSRGRPEETSSAAGRATIASVAVTVTTC